LIVPVLFVVLLLSLVPLSGALAQPESPPPGVGDAPHAGPGFIFNPDQTAPTVAPEQFRQVLLIVDFPADAWTPIHTPGGNVSTSVLEGAIITRVPGTDGDHEVTYEVGDTFVVRPGEYVQVGNATASNARVRVTALLPIRAPLTIYQDGFTSNAYPSVTDWSYTHDIGGAVPGPSTAFSTSIAIDGRERAADNSGRAFDALSLYGGVP
jgi:hypothetical protein